ncbi:MAG: tetratricopeptide repeat protein, partial [Planctomycetaceae bacterium]|nr:tetratricopeptide repeat protein [Planctomycetaceae bacterium]
AGNPEAHRHLAILLSQEISTQSSQEELRNLYWHLTSAGRNESAEFAFAWGRYYLAVGDVRAAKAYFEKAVEQFPELWQTLGLIELSLGNKTGASERFQRTADYFEKQLHNDPSNRTVRIEYARTLIQLLRFDEAQVIFEQGQRIDPDGPWPTWLATLVVTVHDVKAAQGNDLSELLTLLDRALKYDSNHAMALNRLMSYAKANVEGNTSLKSILARVLADGEQPGLAHLAMGNLCWLEGNREQAQDHFEQALAFRNDMPVILNNMAWLVAHDKESPDLDRAMEMITAALEQDPENMQFIDTRGSIYFLKEEWKLALTDLEKALPVVKDKSGTHEKLARIYEELGHPEIAEQHRLLMDSRAQPATPQ